MTDRLLEIGEIGLLRDIPAELDLLTNENNLLKAEGILIIEHSKHLDISQLAHFKEARKYGGSVFSFFM